MPGQRFRVLHQYRELLLVLVAAAIGLTVRSPLAWAVHHDGIDVFLVVLVFSTSLNIEPASLRRLPALWLPLSLALLVGIGVLPGLSWLAAHFVAPGALREGVETIGLAPCEIASIATTAIAGGDVALSGGVLLGSTMLTVCLAGPILAMESAGASIHPWSILGNLLFIVAIPLAAGIAARGWLRMPPQIEGLASATSALTLAALVALVAAEVHFSRAYVALCLCVLAFLAASVLIGHLIGSRSGASTRKAVLLTTSMRDFAIAAGLATAAFGPAAAAPLGLYGITVIVWGTGVSGLLRARASN
jgi:predicted Na+-dependent transporter